MEKLQAMIHIFLKKKLIYIYIYILPHRSQNKHFSTRRTFVFPPNATYLLNNKGSKGTFMSDAHFTCSPITIVSPNLFWPTLSFPSLFQAESSCSFTLITLSICHLLCWPLSTNSCVKHWFHWSHNCFKIKCLFYFFLFFAQPYFVTVSNMPLFVSSVPLCLSQWHLNNLACFFFSFLIYFILNIEVDLVLGLCVCGPVIVHFSLWTDRWRLNVRMNSYHFLLFYSIYKRNHFNS